MWSLQNLLFILCIPLSCVTHAAKTSHVSGYEGTIVTVSCLYKRGHMSYAKYLCRNECASDSDVLISTTKAKTNKYSIRDDKERQVFTVTISDLRLTDAGKYWCGVSKTGFDRYPSEVKVNVKPKWCCVKSEKLSSIVGRPVTTQCPYPPQHKDNRKFLCKGGHRKNCAEMVTSQSRFTLQDNLSSSIFMVTIKELKPGDAGTYWCVSDPQWSAGNYTKIQLSVVSHSTLIPPTTVEPVGSQSTHGIPDKHIIDAAVPDPVVFIVSRVLLILTLAALVLIYKYKCHKVQEAAVINNGNKTEAPPAEKVMDGEDIHENQDSVCLRQDASSDHSDDAGEDSVYQNTTDDIVTSFP